MAKDELMVAKINASLRILEWSKDAIEPGIGGSPNQLHVALAEAFRTIFGVVSESIGTSVTSGESNGTSNGEPESDVTTDHSEVVVS
ncbi:MAG TPA: hypothetical protein VNG11_05495 [Chloroflexota bacterium]|nr:hypothetical protein [Chloroflexota bacterium]